jgi:hypothetical protein
MELNPTITDNNIQAESRPRVRSHSYLKKTKNKKFKNLTVGELFSLWSVQISDILKDILKFIDNVKELNVKNINILNLLKDFTDIFIKKKRALYSGLTLLFIIFVLNINK